MSSEEINLVAILYPKRERAEEVRLPVSRLPPRGPSPLTITALSSPRRSDQEGARQ